MDEPTVSRRQHVLTVGLDDYFHAEALKGAIDRAQWYRFESRLQTSTQRALDLLDECDTKATFFVMGWVAERHPEIVREVVRRGHEIASQGYCHRSVREMSRSEFREDIIRSRNVLEQASGLKVVGNRCARPLVSPKDLWALDVMIEEGYHYDSSLRPTFRRFGGAPWRRFVHQHSLAGKQLWELPFSTWDIMGCMLPIGGGTYFRQIPHSLIQSRLEKWHRTCSSPFVMYFHVWELDNEQPRISSASLFAKVRHYRNLGQISWMVKEHLKTYHFGSIAEYLGLTQGVCTAPSGRYQEELSPAATAANGAGSSRVVSTAHAANMDSVTIVVPFFNEQAILPYFFNTLENLEGELSRTYKLKFVFVDDGSSDRTWQLLKQRFGNRPDCLLFQHKKNMGVAAAILDGIRHASTEIVCSIDSDCTYDPMQLKLLIPELTEDVDLVTGSPYHPKGEVVNVPAWRLSLSKGASFLYRRVLRQKLHTYTSCFRVYRKSALRDIEVQQPGFLGVAEMIGRLDLQGRIVRECPVKLEARLLGRSKMRILGTICGHILIIMQLLWLRAFRSREPHRPKAAEYAKPQLTSKKSVSTEPGSTVPMIAGAAKGASKRP
jgi:polysaccharide deacetylase family protein (PEP-CTERM system associated)